MDWGEEWNTDLTDLVDGHGLGRVGHGFGGFSGWIRIGEG